MSNHDQATRPSIETRRRARRARCPTGSRTRATRSTTTAWATTTRRRTRRPERQVVVLFAVSDPGARIGFLVAYFALPPGDTPGVDASARTSLLGLGLALGLLGIGVAAVHWAKALMNDPEKSEDRHLQRSSDENREACRRRR